MASGEREVASADGLLEHTEVLPGRMLGAEAEQGEGGTVKVRHWGRGNRLCRSF